MSLPRDDLSGYTTVYCDSKMVLEQAWQAGLSRTARVLSSSPAMLVGGYAEPAQRDFDVRRRVELNDATFSFTQHIYEALRGHEILDSFAILVARMGILFQSTIVQAATLQNEDFDEPRAILMSHTGHASTDRLFHAPWTDLFSDAPKAKSFTFPIPMDDAYLMRGGNPPGFATRLRQAAWDKLAYRLFLKIGSFMPRAFIQGRAFVFSENELLVETGAWLGLSGFSLRTLSQSGFSASVVDAAALERIEVAVRECLVPVLRGHMEKWVNEKWVEKVGELFVKRVLTECSLYLSAEKFWAEKLNQLSIGGSDVILMNYPGGASVYALIAQSQKRSVPVIAFEHGATRQFCATHKQMVAAFENNFVDWVMAFNTLSSKMSNANPFARGVSVAVGFPKDYFSNLHRKPDPGMPPILFVSTTLYIGNMQSLSGSLIDVEAAEREIGIVTNVLEKIPHKVAYKPYPSIRYSDPDPIHEAVQRSENINFFSAGFDLRYEVSKYRVIITSRATSTVSWCVMSGKPLVFINYPDHMPLTNDAREAFRKGVFLIEVENEGWMDELRTFLSRPIVDIEAKWAEKADDRARLIRDFFTLPMPGGGKRAASHIRQIALSGTIQPEILHRAL